MLTRRDKQANDRVRVEVLCLCLRGGVYNTGTTREILDQNVPGGISIYRAAAANYLTKKNRKDKEGGI